LLVVLGSLWGGNPSFSKALAVAGLNPIGAIFWLTLFAGAILMSICALRRTPLLFDRTHLTYYALIGGLGISLSWAAQVFVTGRISAGFGSVLILLSPLLTYLFAVVGRLEGLSMWRIVGTGVGFIGAGMLVFPKGSLPSPELVPVALFGLVIPTAYAAMNVYAQFGRPKGTDNIALAAGTMFTACIFSGLFALVSGRFHMVGDIVGTPGIILIFFAISTSASYVTYFTIVELAGAVFMGQVGYIATVMGVSWGVIIYNETIPGWMWVATATVAIGVALVNFGKGKAQPKAAVTVTTAAND